MSENPEETAENFVEVRFTAQEFKEFCDVLDTALTAFWNEICHIQGYGKITQEDRGGEPTQSKHHRVTKLRQAYWLLDKWFDRFSLKKKVIVATDWADGSSFTIIAKVSKDGGPASGLTVENYKRFLEQNKD